MKVFLAGNLGYIGTTMSKVLHDAGFDVVGYDCGYFLDGFIRGNPKDLISEYVHRQIYGDVREVKKSDLEGCDAVVDYAGLANDPASDLNPLWTEEINRKAPVRLATLAKEAGIPRYVFASSCSTYGSRGGDEVMSEDSPLGPITAYARAKVGVEQDVGKLSGKSFCPTFMRNATVFGLSYRQRFDLVVNNLTGWAFTTGKVKLLSAGTSWRPNLHVEDCCNGVKALLEAPEDAIRGQAFNIGMDSENYRVVEIANIVKQVVPNCHLEVGLNAPVDPRSYRVSFGKVRKTLPNFKPRWTVKMGVEQLHSHFKEMNLDYETFMSKKFHDVEKIKSLAADGSADGSLRMKKFPGGA